MKSIISLILEAKKLKDKDIISFKDFREMFFAESPENVNDYWNIAIDMYVNDNFDASKWYVKKYDRKPKLHTEYLGERENTKTIDGVKITGFTNGIYIENDKKYIVIGEKSILNVI